MHRLAFSQTRKRLPTKNIKILFGLLVCAAVLWVVTLVTFASQVRRDGNTIRPTQSQGTSCSSSSSSSGGE
ncbi:MAG: hypothetical protein PHV34_07250 [Verrucomicrobiae bacterium]|nr:hypothetical protein [Verrucomicrobiae bacterium]